MPKRKRKIQNKPLKSKKKTKTNHVVLDKINIKETIKLLNKFEKLKDKLYKLDDEGKLDGKLHASKLQLLYDNDHRGFLQPPKSACLKMSQILKLHKLRHNKKWTKNDYILVIEPQSYNKVSKLAPNNFMFKENIIEKKGNKYEIGYFHSGKSGIAQSGDGGDFGDIWWLANTSLIRWLKSTLKKGEKLLKMYS